MYVITKTAAWWQESTTSPQPASERPARITRWADRPLKLPRLTCLALRFEGDDVRVLVQRKSGRQWLPLEKVLGEAEARRWVLRDFTRGR